MANGTWDKIIDNGYGDVSVVIDGKPFPLRYTVCQMEKLEAFHAKAANKEVEAEKALLDTAEGNLDICEIALNPVPGEVAAEREWIAKKLDLDKIRKLAKFWLATKVQGASDDIFSLSGKKA